MALVPVLAAMLLALPDRAEACGVPESGLTDSTPVAGQTYPANAALRFAGFGISLTNVTVAIDGEPATLVAAEPSSFPAILALVEPQPQPGQTVTIGGNFCEFDECDPTEISFIAGEPDTEAPVAKEVTFTAFDHADFTSSGGDCMSDSDLSLYVHADASPQAAGQAPVRYRIAFDPDAGAPEPPGFAAEGLFAPDVATTRAISIVTEQLGDVAAEDLCLRVEVVDLAGNVGETIEVCKPCFMRSSDAAIETDTPPEPIWSDADLVPGSACAGPEPETGSDSDATGEATDSDASGTDSSATGEPPTTGEPTTGEPTTAGESSDGETADQSEDPDKGCGCHNDAGAGGPLALIAGLFALLRRRRR